MNKKSIYYDEKYTVPGAFPLGPNRFLDHEIAVGTFEMPAEYSGPNPDGGNPSISSNISFPPRS